jgi:hypothetical protein
MLQRSPREPELPLSTETASNWRNLSFRVQFARLGPAGIVLRANADLRAVSIVRCRWRAFRPH